MYCKSYVFAKTSIPDLCTLTYFVPIETSPSQNAPNRSVQIKHAVGILDHLGSSGAWSDQWFKSYYLEKQNLSVCLSVCTFCLKFIIRYQGERLSNSCLNGDLTLYEDFVNHKRACVKCP